MLHTYGASGISVALLKRVCQCVYVGCGSGFRGSLYISAGNGKKLGINHNRFDPNPRALSPQVPTLCF